MKSYRDMGRPCRSAVSTAAKGFEYAKFIVLLCQLLNLPLLTMEFAVSHVTSPNINIYWASSFILQVVLT